MIVLSRIWDFIRDLLGFRKNSKYVRSYLNEANIRSGIYMGGIIVLLETWLIIRQTNKYVKPDIDNYSGFEDKFKFAYGILNLYIVFFICGLALMLFAITYIKNKKKDSKLEFILNLVIGSICIFWFFMIFPADDLKDLFPLKLSKSDYTNDTLRARGIVRYLTVLIYVMMPIFGGLIISHALYKHFKGGNNTIISIFIIITFSAICLIFGVRVSYYDFCYPADRFERRKMIICFLTMIIFLACLLIWKPYISIIMLTTIFMLFRKMLMGYDGREFVEGDDINYITFLISLTMIAISIYQQRITEAKKDMKLEHDAKYDASIEIYNANYLSKTIKENEKNDPNYINDKAYLFINLVNFKAVNDQRGFDEGNEFLNKFSEYIKSSFENDLISRQADDHFIIFAERNGVEAKIDILKNLLNELAHGLFINLKVGIYKPKANEAPNRCIDKARYACGLIKVKDETYIEYDEKMDQKFTKIQYIVNHLDEAIEKGWIVAYYQPVVWADSRQLCGAEALARWIDPVYGFLSPADFIPTLEDTHLIHKLDQAIIEYVCREMRRKLDENDPVVPVSINFSRLDFELMNVEEVLENAVNKYNIDKRYLHVEITESALADNVDFLNKNILRLRELGYAIWLDDFGSGYSSLNVLKDFVFDVIKIDMKFLTNFEKNEKTKDILDCIIRLADRLGMKSLTEGVETEAEAKFLDEIGCGRLQGFLFGKPFKLDDFEEKIKNGDLIISDALLI